MSAGKCSIMETSKGDGKEKQSVNKDVMFSSKTDSWETPRDFFQKLDNEFHFNLDPCADESNHKCDTYFTEAENGLIQEWGA